MESIKDKVVFGGLYRYNPSEYEQHYGWAVPVLAGDKVFMQDTYQINRPAIKKDQSVYDACVEMINSFSDSERGKSVIWYSDYNYASKANEIITEGNLDKYTFVCDLNDYRELDRSEYKEWFDDNDVVNHVKLFFEHGYKWDLGSVGITIVKKDANPVPVLQLEEKIDSTRNSLTLPIPAYTDRIDDIKELKAKTSIPKYVEFKLNQLLTLNELLKRQQDAVHEITSKKFSYTYKFESNPNAQELLDVHPDIDRYLHHGSQWSTSCGFDDGYGYIKNTDNCVNFAKSQTAIGTIVKSGKYRAVILLIRIEPKNPDKIQELFTMNITPKNLEYSIDIVENDTEVDPKDIESSNRLDSYETIDQYIEDFLKTRQLEES